MFEFLLVLGSLILCVIWAIEEQLQVIMYYDRYGYLLSLVVTSCCFCISHFCRATNLSRTILFIYVVSYLLTMIIISFAQSASSGSIYTFASMTQWMPITYIVAFLLLPHRQAVISSILVYIVILILLGLPYLDVVATASSSLKGLLLHVALSHSVYLFCMFGIVKLKQTQMESELHARKMELAANVDGLLGISNRRFLQQQLDNCAIQASPVSLLIIDIDHFKVINDTFGHLVGDDILREVTLCMQQNLRPEDMIGRWGGEEFLVMIKHTASSNVAELAERIRESVEQHEFPPVGKVTVSIGVAEYREHASVEQTFSLADDALYKAKQSGRNRVIMV